MKKLAKILYIAPNLRLSNGVTSFLMNAYPYVCSEGYRADFLLIQKVDSPFNSIVEKNGGKIYVYPEKNKYRIENYDYVKKVLSDGGYDIIHVNTSGMWAYWVLLAADRLGVKMRIYHSHNPRETTSLKGIVREELFDRLCFKHTNYFLACTEHAGISVFGKQKFTVVKNGIDYPKFYYSESNRIKHRKEFYIEDSIVVGTVCRQCDQKNPFYTIDIMEELCEINPNFKLTWIGTGPLLSSVKEYAKKKGLEKNVLFLGDRADISELYSMMDVFLLPSKYEGLGIVYIEAQVNGLPCFASDVVPRDTRISDHIFYMSINNAPCQWAKEIQNCVNELQHEGKIHRNPFTYSLDYDVTNTSHSLIEMYRQLGVK